MGDINIKSTTIEKGLDLAKEFLSKLIGPSIDELGLMWSDNVKMWRLKLQIKNLEKVRKIVEDNNIDIKQVNLKVLVPYMEGVSLEEDETLQDMWANLFANYIDASKNLKTTVYPSILSQLSTDDMKVIEYMVGNKGILPVGPWQSNFPKFDPEPISNLVRLGIIAEVANFSKYETSSDPYEPIHERFGIEQIEPEEFYLTQFGQQFVNACKR